MKMRFYEAGTAVILATALVGCGLLSASQSFEVLAWKSGSKDERRHMAPDFLKRYQTKGMSVSELKVMLGDPDREYDIRSYDLSASGPPPRGTQNVTVFRKHPQLYVHFKEGRVDRLDFTFGLPLPRGPKFESQLWKVSKPSDRLKMCADLIDSKVLEGVNEHQLTQLLGPPNGKGEKHEIEYDLGFRGIDMVTLTFTLDDNGRVSQAEILEH
jgi:hypothetical protein